MTASPIRSYNKASSSQGFTLIELLVVIAVIAVLMGILMPTLKAAKQMAQGTVCTANVKQLSLAWTMYADGNNGRLVGAQVQIGQVVDHDWAHRRVQSGDPGYISGLSGDESELAGIKAGALYPYVNDTKVYHCVADSSWRKNKGRATLDAKESPYRSYAIQDGLNGDGWFEQSPARKLASLRRPSSIYVFLEEDEGSGSHNWGSWILDKDGDSWHDPISIWHKKASTLGFADGHAELHNWRDKNTWLVSDGTNGPGQPVPGGYSQDLEFMQKGYVNMDVRQQR